MSGLLTYGLTSWKSCIYQWNISEISVSSVHNLFVIFFLLEREQYINVYLTMQSGSLFIVLSHFMLDFACALWGMVDNLKTESSQGDLNQERW